MSVELCRRALRVAAVAALILGVLPATGAFAADFLSIAMDEARLIKVPERSATLIIGNPLIADVTIQPGGIMVVTGKGFGATNIMALDRSGAVVMDRMLEVVAPDKLVTVFRGVARETYSCAPDCQRRVMPGDTEREFGVTLGQTTSRAAAAATIAEQSQPKE